MANRSDNFNRANDSANIGTPSDGGGAWTTTAGTWGVSSNAIYRSAGSGYSAAYLDAAVSAGTLSAKLTSAASSGIAMRIVDGSNFVWLQLTGGLAYLWKRVSGTFTQLGSTYSGGFTTGDTFSLEVDASGNWIARKSGTSIITATDNVHSSGTGVGFVFESSSAAWDDFTFAEPAAPSELSGNVTLDAVAPAGTLADGGASGISGNVALDAVAPAGTLGVAPGAYSIPALTNWSGSVQAAVTVPWVTFQRLADGVQVLVLADQVTNGGGDLSGTNAALAAGTTYMVCGWNADGSSRFAKPVTAT